MPYFFLGFFLLGLALAVYWMLLGVERGDAPTAPPISAETDASWARAAASVRASLTTPVVAGFATAFGATGYLLVRYTTLRPAPLIVLAIIAAGLGVAGAVALVAKWAVPSAQRDPVDERYLLQGHLARVTEPIGAAAAGRISYDLDGTRYAAEAVSVDGKPVAAETDVVIERVEHGVAYVEPWAEVEQRL